MKTIKFGDMLTVERGFIVHGCNAQGVMGSGIAGQIRLRWPKVYDSYKDFIDECNTEKVDPLGQVVLVQVKDDLYVANAITQRDFGRDKTVRYCSYSAIHRAMKYIAHMAGGLITNDGDYGYPVHYPMIGAGLANGDWSVISDIIDDAFASSPQVNHTLWIYE